MSIPDWFPKSNPKKLLYQIPLIIIFIIALMQSTVNPDTFVNKTVNYLSTNYYYFFDNYIKNRNFLTNSSFETIPSVDGQIPGWQYFGWQLTGKKVFNGRTALVTLNLVTKQKHTLDQTIFFFFPKKYTVKVTLDYLVEENTDTKLKVNLTAFHLDRSRESYSWEESLSTSGEWQRKTFTYPLSATGYRLDLSLDGQTRETPIYLDNLSLTLTN